MKAGKEKENRDTCVSCLMSRSDCAALSYLNSGDERQHYSCKHASGLLLICDSERVLHLHGIFRDPNY